MGERTPHLDPYARGVFFGLSAKSEKCDMIRAILEGVTFSLKDCLEIIKEMGVAVKDVRASGGGGKSKLWRQLQADVFETPITTVNSSEGPALGVAILAGVGAGTYDSVQQACKAIIREKTWQEPDGESAQKYKPYYEIYRTLYTSIRENYKTLASVMEHDM